MIDFYEDIYWKKLIALIEETLSFNASHYTSSFMNRRISCRLRALNINSYQEYYDILSKNNTEQKKLLDELTIHVTHFFRDALVWDFLMKKVIPDLLEIKKLQNSNKIRVWSAGCSTGEEIITILICFYEVLGKDISNFDFSFLATDIDNKSIDFAKKGVYDKLQFKETNPTIVEKYFESVGEQYKLKQEYLRIIEYNVGDIILEIKPKKLDIIFCRNTVIYFNAEIKEKLYLKFYDILNPDGFFIMGKTETLLGLARNQFKIYNTIEKIYKK